VRRLIVLLGLCIIMGGPATAGDGQQRTAIETVIRAQVAAFRRDDPVAAFGLASPAIQRQFGDPETFLAMVAQAYRPVYRPRRMVFLETHTDGAGRRVQKVLVEGPDGDTVTALYPMVLIEGRWRIDGCILVKTGGERI